MAILNIENINHVGIRVKEKNRSIGFYKLLGFQMITDVGFEQGHPVIMRHESGVVLNLLGPSNVAKDENILMDVPEKHTGITHVALTVSNLEDAKLFMDEHHIAITGSFSFGNMSAIFIRDPDRNVIELDAYMSGIKDDMGDYSNHL